MVVLRYTALWFGLLGLALLNATAREVIYRDPLGEGRAQQVSAVTMAALTFGYAWLIDRRWPFRRPAIAVAVGLVWAALTAGFEFFLTVVVSGKSAEAALAQYDLPSGNLWPLVVVAVLLAPPAAWALQRLRSPA